MRHKISTKIISGVLSVLMAASCFGTTAVTVYAEDPALQPVLSETVESETDVSSTAASDANSASTDNSAIASESTNDVNNNTEDKNSATSEAVAAFLEAVEAIDYNTVVRRANSLGLLQKKVYKDPDNEELAAEFAELWELFEADQEQLEDADDMFYALAEDEQTREDVATAYAALSKTMTDVSNRFSYPVEESEDEGKTEKGGSDLTLEEITSNLYADMPDKPTGYYIGKYGLPVATGETKISITEWSEDLLNDSNSGRLNAEALNAEGQIITVPKISGKDYAIVSVLTQVEYPANGASLKVEVPDSVTVVSYSSSSDAIIAAVGSELDGIVNDTLKDVSAATKGFYLLSEDDFEVKLAYQDDNQTIEKTLTVKVSGNDGEIALYGNGGVALADSATPSVTTGKITKVEKVSGTWLIWFNGQEAYCCDNGLKGSPTGCPTYNYTYTSKLEPGQYTGDHYTTQTSVWGGVGQLSLGSLSEVHDISNYSDSEYAITVADLYDEYDSDTLQAAYQYYNDTQLWIIENFPESTAAKIYMDSINQVIAADDDAMLTNGADNGYYTFIYTPSVSGWQRVAVIGPAIEEGGGGDLPDNPKMQYYATKSGSFTFKYTINTDKIQRNTYEKVDNAVIDIEPTSTSGSISGGSWSISPSGKQTVTTSGHTNDNDYQNNGGDGSKSWTLSYSVSKSAGPCDTQAEADSAAQSAVNSAISAAKSELSSFKFKYDEVTVPYGFEEDNGDKGSHQTISVSHDADEHFTMNDDEWSLKVNINKTDSETEQQIANDALFEVYEWDVVTQKYIPYGDYNMYSVDRNADGTYSVRNHSSYADTDEKTYTMYYTQRNEGKFIIVETKAPAGYVGDWTDIEELGTADTPLGKRAYYIEITKENDGSIITLDNKDYSANIAASAGSASGDGISYTLLTSGGVETVVTISKASDDAAAAVTYQDSSRTYDTDNSKKGANEDSYFMTPKDDVFQNDRVLGEISISKVDLDAVRYVDGRDAYDTAIDSGESHGDAIVDGAIYDLYVAEDIMHPDGVTGVVDYSKITYDDGTPIWHTTIRENSGHWNEEYLPVLTKDALVASAKVVDGWLSFSNLYLGKYYIVERGTGVIIPVDNDYYHLSGTYLDIDSKTKEATGTESALAQSNGEYTEYVYKNQFSYVEYGKDQDSAKTYEGVYVSYSEGYLCDEHNYYVTPSYSTEASYVEKTTFEDNRQASGEERDTTEYSKYYHIIKSNDLAESQEQVMKADIQISKNWSSTGESTSHDIKDAGFTLYLISDLSKADQIETTRSGKYKLNSIWNLYCNEKYDQDHPKWDFSGEAQAIAKTYECDASEIAAYNATLTEAGDYRNGVGEGWVSTGNANEYQLSEIFSNDTGDIRVWGLPYGQYLLIETTTPADRFQADPIIIDVTPDTGDVPVSRQSDSKGAQTTPTGSYMKYTVLNEELEAYLRIIKTDDETGKAVLREGTAFQIYWIDSNGNYVLDKNGNPRLVTMTETLDGSVSKKIDTFYTTADGYIALPEKLEVGMYRIVEVNGPEGFYNEWLDTAQYGENGILLDKDDNGVYSTGTYYVDFAVSTNRIYEANGERNEDDQDNLVIEEKYYNHETLGKITIRKTGEVLTGFENGKFTYETRPLDGAVYQVIAAEDIVTQDNQKDADGNRTLWYKEGDVVATVTTTSDTYEVNFAPGRTTATYDFLKYWNDGTTGEVNITVPLGKYKVVETKPPYGYVLNDTEYTVEFTWTNQFEDVIFSDQTDKVYSVKVESTASPAYSYYNDNMIGDVNKDGTITEDDAQLVRNYLDELAKIDAMTDEEAAAYTAQYTLTAEQKHLANVTNNQIDYSIADDPEVTYADAETISRFVNGDIDRFPYTTDHPEYETKTSSETFANTRVSKADAAFTESQVLKYYNDREVARVGVFKFDIKTNKYVAGAVFDLYTDEDIYNADGKKIFSAGDKIAASPETKDDGYTYFDVDVPIRGENYVKGETPEKPNSSTNSGNYTVKEVVAPDGYYLDKEPKHVSFVYNGEAVEVLDSECKNVPTTIYVSKRELTGDDELPGATLTITDNETGKVVREWVSTTEKHEVNALSFKDGKTYTLTETRPADGYALADDIVFKLVRQTDKDTGEELDAVDVYYQDKDTGEWKYLDDETVIMRDDITRVKISKKDITDEDELPGAKLEIKDKDGKTVEKWTSTDEPHYIEKLPAGKYTLIETSAPKGYLVSEEVEFTVKPVGDIQHVTMYDKPDEDRGLWIHKVDAATGQPVEGIAFQIINADTGKIMTGEKDGVVYDYYRITNEAGNIWFALPNGNYYYQEIKVTADWLCNSTLYPFTISDDTPYIEVTFENVHSPIYGIMEFFKGKKSNNLKTGTLANGEGSEVFADVTYTGSTVVTSTARTPVTLILGVVILFAAIIGSIVSIVVVKRRKCKDARMR